jgi:hypothetical protein
LAPIAFCWTEERLMSKGKGSCPEEWLAGIHSAFDSIEQEAEAVARNIADSEDDLRAGLLRAEWSRFVGHLTELAVAVSDMLERTVNSRRPRDQAAGAASDER